MHILNIIQCSNLGGMEHASLRLMQALQRRGHQLSLISLHPLGPLAPQLEACGIDAIGLGYGQQPFWCWLAQLRRELRRQRPDALLLTGHSLPVLLAVTGWCRDRRLLTIHFHHTGVKSPWFWRLHYFLARRQVNAITFPSDFVRDEALRIFPGLAGKAHTVRYPYPPMAVITPSERMAARQRFGLPEGGPVIGNAGWLISRKRFDVFLHAAAAIHQERPDVRFLIAGNGPDRKQLESLSQALGIYHSVVWVDWVADIRSVYAALDLLLFNSDWDALPCTPTEAIVHGIPVVSSVLHGGLVELLRPGVDAVLLDHHDVPALAAAALELLADPAAAAAMAHRARERVLTLSDPDRLAAWHEQALSGAAPR